MNMQHASLYVGKSEKTLRRMIRKGTLHAMMIEGKYDLQESDLDALNRVPVPDTLSSRLDALESRLAAIEGIIGQLGAKTPSRPSETQKRVSESSTLPPGWVPVSDLIKQHHLPRSTVLRDMKDVIHIGSWRVSGHQVNKALDSEGIAEFQRRYLAFSPDV